MTISSLGKYNLNTINRRLIGKGIIHIFLILGSIVFLFPFVWLISTSLKLESQMYAIPPQLIPKPVTFEHFINLFKYFNFFKYLTNTVFLTLTNGMGAIVSSTIVGYGFARLRFPGRDKLFFLVLASIMIPQQVVMIPLYLIYRNLGWINTFFPLWIPSFFGSAFNIFLMRQFLRTIPRELEESALIDGANNLQIFTRIMIPLIRPVIITVTIFTFMGVWNDFMGPLIYLNSEAKFTLALALRVFQQGHSSEPGLMMAAASLMTLPLVVFFFVAQKQFIEGVIITGLKEG